MEDDCRPLLSSEQQTAESYSQRGSTDSLDFRAKRPFYVEPRNIVGDVPQERVSAEAAILNSRVHYYSRLTASSDRLLICYMEHNDGHIYTQHTLGYKAAYVDTSDWEFPDVCRYYFGKFGQWSSLVFSMVSLVGAMVVYWVLMSNFLYNSGQFIYNYSHNVNMSDSEFGTNGSDRVICPFPNTNHEGNYTVSTVSTVFLTTSGNDTSHSTFEHWWSKTNTIPLYLIILLLPLLCFRSASFFARTLFPQFTGVLTLAFFIHNCIITLMKSNKHQEKQCEHYTAISADFRTHSSAINFLDNFPTSDVMVFVARGFLLFQMITVYPLLGYLVRVQVMGQIFGNHYPSFFHVLALNILIVGAGVLMAKFYPNIGSIIRFSGATCGLALVFVFPSLVHMISLKRQGLLRWPSALFHSFLILLGMANLLGQFFM
ncbi:hypothetical protein F7725_015220 [Dissostichus mawsoni]|uniref:Neutral amino acid transporter 9 n=1 Tax=Dissostichus mawsoni TaxID=36200 RepID=A0A7J5YHT5_DISMA|nr:hypothetical protein F7725_015220 [Dissostichus mawsoni]